MSSSKKASTDTTVTIDFDPNDLTAADLAFIEEYSGKSVAEFAEAAMPSMRAMIAIVYVLLHNDDPTVTVEDVEKMKLNALTETLGNTEAREKS